MTVIQVRAVWCRWEQNEKFQMLWKVWDVGVDWLLVTMAEECLSVSGLLVIK